MCSVKKTFFLSSVVIALLLITASCTTAHKTGITYSGGKAESKELGLSGNEIGMWEDGMRTSGEKGTYEWWYFDAKLDDGSTLVIVFYTKIMLNITHGLEPVISLKLTGPDGTELLNRTYETDPSQFSADTERCDVRIGNNRFAGDLVNYRIELDFDDISADISLKNEAWAWRPGTGHSYFKNDKGTSFFAWLPAVPRGKVSGSLSFGDSAIDISGSGYHDHNWGNASIVEQMHDWYWGRAEVGQYTVITSFITAADSYGGGQGSTFVLFDGNKVLAEDGNFVTCSLEDVYMDSKTGKPVANIIRYDYNDGNEHYIVSYLREKDIESALFTDLMGGFTGFLAKLSGFDGAYLRFSGKVQIDFFEGDEIVKTVSQDSAVWELMYLGHAQ